MTNLSGETMNFFQNDFEGYTFTSVETDILEVEKNKVRRYKKDILDMFEKEIKNVKTIIK